jgi:2-(1,2-epoxy-1,2-dihydrophenyl)acetyl-CoA isomerase
MTARLDIADGVGVITLDRPDVLNAFDDELGRATLDAVKEAASVDHVRCIAITGAGRAFSAGEDLGALQEGYERGRTPDLGRILAERYNPLVRAVRAAPKPVLAAVNGVAAGAGASLALACDTRVASEDARFVLGFARVGLVPDAGALWFLARAVGPGRAFELATRGAPLGAREAAELGLFDRVEPADRFDSAWRARARELADGPTLAHALTKGLLEDALVRTLEEQLAAEIGAQTEAGRSADHLEGVRAFLDKRAPRFTGC